MKSKNLLLLIGVFLNILADVNYYQYGYNSWMLTLFLSSLFAIAVHFFLKEKLIPKIKVYEKKDFLVVLLLLVIFTPIYLAFIYTIPWQVNTDEVTVMFFAKELLTKIPFDPFGLNSDYFGFPSLSFLFFGFIGKILGGIDLLHMRIAHALSGLSIVVLAYLFFRTYVSKLQSFAATLILGSNHALVAINRMALRDNSGLLIELLAFTLLLLGIQRKSLFYTFLGAAVSGIGFYTYYPGRIIIFIWLVTLVMFGVFFRKVLTPKELLRLFLTSVLGFTMVAIPVMLDTIKNPTSLSFPRQQFLFFEEGQKLEMYWTHTSSKQDAIKTNIFQGITMYNNKVVDQGYIYPNYGHGFVDPLTGLLIWAGLIITFLKPYKTPIDILTITGFFLLYFIFSFLIAKTPDYTRLLITLPFAAYFVTEFLKTATETFHISYRYLLIVVAIILFWNLSLFGDFALKGIAEGNDVGSTARYVEARKNIQNYQFYLVADQQQPYYLWGEYDYWKIWLGFFIPENQSLNIVSPDAFTPPVADHRLTLFMSSDVWLKLKNRIRAYYPTYNMHNLKTDGSLLGIEIY